MHANIGEIIVHIYLCAGLLTRPCSSTSSLFLMPSRNPVISSRSPLISSRSPLIEFHNLLFSSLSSFFECLRSLISALFMCSTSSLSCSTPSNPSKRCVVFFSSDHVLDRCSSVDASRCAFKCLRWSCEVRWFYKLSIAFNAEKCCSVNAIVNT